MNQLKQRFGFLTFGFASWIGVLMGFLWMSVVHAAKYRCTSTMIEEVPLQLAYERPDASPGVSPNTDRFVTVTRKVINAPHRHVADF